MSIILYWPKAGKYLNKQEGKSYSIVDDIKLATPYNEEDAVTAALNGACDDLCPFPHGSRSEDIFARTFYNTVERIIIK